MTGIAAAIHHYLVRPVGNKDFPSKKTNKQKKIPNPVRPVAGGQFLLGRTASDPRTEQPTVAGDMVNKSVSGDLLPKWHAGDNIHALPAFTFAVAPGHPSEITVPSSCRD